MDKKAEFVNDPNPASLLDSMREIKLNKKRASYDKCALPVLTYENETVHAMQKS